MASMHYGTPSSLPSDYAILSRYACTRQNGDRDDQHDHDIYDQDEPTDIQDDMNPDGRLIRRTTFPSSYVLPVQPNISEPFNPKALVSDEYTPLLVPRIEEEADSSTDTTHPQSAAQIYRDEFRILLKYTLPVWGYASFCCTLFST